MPTRSALDKFVKEGGAKRNPPRRRYYRPPVRDSYVRKLVRVLHIPIAEARRIAQESRP